MTREIIIGEIRRIAKELGQSQLSRSEFLANSEISKWYIDKLFGGCWNEAVAEAGLVPHTEKDKIDEDKLFIEMKRVFLDLGGICTRTEFGRRAEYSVDVYKKRWGGRWASILWAFRGWLE